MRHVNFLSENEFLGCAHYCVGIDGEDLCRYRANDGGTCEDGLRETSASGEVL